MFVFGRVPEVWSKSFPKSPWLAHIARHLTKFGVFPVLSYVPQLKAKSDTLFLHTASLWLNTIIWNANPRKKLESSSKTG